jgi:hypothetical protein
LPVDTNREWRLAPIEFFPGFSQQVEIDHLAWRYFFVSFTASTSKFHAQRYPFVVNLTVSTKGF